MTTIFARSALLDDGWARNVRLDVVDGMLSSIEADVAGEPNLGIVIPGLVNAHSHAFQRVLVGHTEQRGPADKDNFWSWRSRMYALARQVDSSALRAIATQVYSEMLATGYTSVAEFHYLHNEPGETQPSELMFDALVDAAQDSGIRLTYVPVLYERAGFNEPDPTEDQRRFACTCGDFLDHYERAAEKAAALGNQTVKVGMGAHSLRAVSPSSLKKISAVAARDSVPFHIHIAEQQLEVEQCLDFHGARPVEWLLKNCDVDESWCLVHATHIDETEISGIVESGAVVCLCPSTEANLGDGLFPLQSFLEQGGRIAIGSDSHVSINPYEELRWLEYGQRLLTQCRNVAAIRRQHTGRNLFELALEGGALASAKSSGGLRTGGVADLVVVDDDSSMLAGHTTRSFIDALVFSGFSLPLDRVMVNGTWHVKNGAHQRAAEHATAYAGVANAMQFDGAKHED